MSKEQLQNRESEATQQKGKIDVLLEKMDNPSIEDIRSGWREKYIELHGVPIRLLGVSHHVKTLEIEEYRSALESAIANSERIIIEGVPTATAPEKVDEAVALVMSLNPKASEEELRKFFKKTLTDNPYMKFFENLGEIAAVHNKALLIADPNQDVLNVIRLQQRGIDVEKTKVGIALAMLLASMGFLHVANRPKMSRRAFLRSMGAGLGLGAMLGIGSFAEGIQVGLSNDRGRSKDPLGFLLYSYLDYRNVGVAEVLDCVAREARGKGSISLIYGRDHVEEIAFYATHPIERKAKYIAYKPFRSVQDSFAREFTYRDSRWEEKAWREKESLETK